MDSFWNALDKHMYPRPIDGEPLRRVVDEFWDEAHLPIIMTLVIAIDISVKGWHERLSVRCELKIIVD